ncbi:integumentary mucin C.1 isoform X1 [Drosophila sechellia]|uniref:integumentary mucin C.1 isoform X1 n=1 Tax=Drosophila sechellia TaxID=7238 RepID=UPI0013DDC7CE|nr:integumentary mucin C.1 isoform X1 [Drosophila sechellia]
MKSAIICVFFIATATWAQDTKPEVPIYPPPPSITTTTTEAPVTTTLTEEPTEESLTTTTTETTSTSSTTEPATTTTTEIYTTSTTEPSYTTLTTKNIPSTTTAITTTTALEPSTTTTTEATTASTTQGDPIYPTYGPPYVRPSTSGIPSYSPTNSWIWNNGNPAVKCYLRNQQEYRSDCYGVGWRPMTICYRCCYYDHNRIAGCSKVHRGRCSWYDYARWISPNFYEY